MTWVAVGGLLCILLTIIFFTRTSQIAASILPARGALAAPVTQSVRPAVSVPAGPSTPLGSGGVNGSSVREAFGRLDVEFVAISSDQVEQTRQLFDTEEVTDLPTVLSKSGGKLLASASDGIRTDGEATKMDIGDGCLTILAQKAVNEEISIAGRFDGASSASFDTFFPPGFYQLLMIMGPSDSGSKDSSIAVIARLQNVHWTAMDFNEVGMRLPAMDRAAPQVRSASHGIGAALYENRGDNTTGFVIKSGAPNFTVQNNTLVGNAAGHQGKDDDTGWFALPVSVTGDFQIDFDAYPDSNDAGSWLFMFDDGSNRGVVVANSTNSSFGTHSLYINSMDDVTNYDQFFNHHTTLASAEAQKFPNQTWTHVTIKKMGDTLTDNVGGQTITADLSGDNFPPTVHIGLGYYATKNVGGNGQFTYSNIRVVQSNQR